jgi:WD40 repeat protein
MRYLRRPPLPTAERFRSKLWNVATGRIALTLQHQGPVTDVAFSNDGRLMVTCGADATARLWPAASLSEADVDAATDRFK